MFLTSLKNKYNYVSHKFSKHNRQLLENFFAPNFVILPEKVLPIQRRFYLFIKWVDSSPEQAIITFLLLLYNWQGPFFTLYTANRSLENEILV